MKAKSARVTFLLVLLAAYWSGSASASLVRYDVGITDGPGDVNISGFLVFNQSGTAPGNIMPDLIDWLISVPGFDFTPGNTQAGLHLDFIVDAAYNVLNDNPGGFAAGVCFSITGCIGAEPPESPRIMFSRDLIIPGGLQYRYPSGDTIVEYGPLFFHNIQYSAPRFLVSTPGTAALVLLGFAWIGNTRRRASAR